MSYTQDRNSWSQRAYEEKGQWENWLNLRDMANAIRYGFSQYRIPKPGQAIKVSQSRERMKRIEAAWALEHSHRGNSSQKPAPAFSQCPILAQCYLDSVLEAVKETNTEDLYE